MTLADLKNQVQAAGFSEDTLKELTTILDSAIARGQMTPEEHQKSTDLIDRDLKSHYSEAVAREEIAIALETYAHELSTTADLAEENIKNISNAQNSTNPVQEKPTTKSPQPG